jgi:hypothetical protein
MERMYLRFEEVDSDQTLLIFAKDDHFTRKVLEIDSADLTHVKVSKSSQNLIILTSNKDLKYKVALDETGNEEGFVKHYHKLEGQVRRQRSSILRSQLVLQPKAFEVTIVYSNLSRIVFQYQILKH